MKQEFSLDSLKEAWKSQESDKRYSSAEIFKMLKRKSISSVKWIFIISILELIFAIVAYIYMFSNISVAEYHQDLLNQLGYWGIIYEVITFIVYGVTFLFIFIFFKSYQGIRVQSSIKELSLDIISFRKVVNYFIYFNIIMLFIILLVLLIPMLSQFPELSNMDWFSSTGLGFIAGIVIFFLSLLGLLWLYYYLVYGTFQRRLKRNLKELDRLE